MPSVLIVGASRGIGLEFAKQYAQAGWQVHATYRTPASELENIADIKTYKLEATSEEDIKQTQAALGDTPIDLLIINAGIYGQSDAYFGHTDKQLWSNAFEVNTIAPMKIAEAFVENVAASDKKIIAALSSKMGSMADNGSGGSYVYRSSKAALNAVMKSMSIDLADEYGINVVVLHPGWVITDMTGTNALITTEESVKGMMSLMEGLSVQDRGKFFDYKGNEILW